MAPKSVKHALIEKNRAAAMKRKLDRQRDIAKAKRTSHEFDDPDGTASNVVDEPVDKPTDAVLNIIDKYTYNGKKSITIGETTQRAAYFGLSLLQIEECIEQLVDLKLVTLDGELLRFEGIESALAAVGTKMMVVESNVRRQ